MACLWPDIVRRKVRKEHLILSEIVRRVPQFTIRRTRVPFAMGLSRSGGLLFETARPDMLFLLPTFYVQIEVDEDGHDRHDRFDEGARLELIAADIGMPGVVVRINPDSAPPMLKRCKMKRLSIKERASSIPVCTSSEGFRSSGGGSVSRIGSSQKRCPRFS